MIKMANSDSVLLKQEETYLECEKKWVFQVLMFVAGFYGVFTYSIRGGIFCNAQTANFVMFAMAIGHAEWSKAAYYLIPMGAYLLGAIVSEALPVPIKKLKFIRWDTLLIFLEMLVVLLLGFIPESAPYQISQVAINFICSMQYNTFRQAQGVPMATTFCTNHVRQVGVWLVKALKGKPDKKFLKRSFNHLLMLIAFVLGGIASAFLCRTFLGKAIWFAIIPLGIVFLNLLYADLKTEKSLILSKPHGH